MKILKNAHVCSTQKIIRTSVAVIHKLKNYLNTANLTKVYRAPILSLYDSASIYENTEIKQL